MNILFVCTGNTCRSPMAEGIAKKLLEGRAYEVLSCGIYAPDGAAASENAILAMEEMGIDISSHIAHNITKNLAEQADLILTVGASHKMAIAGAFGEDAIKKTYTIAEYAGGVGDITDPYGGSLEVYRECAEKLYMLIKKITEEKLA